MMVPRFAAAVLVLLLGVAVGSYACDFQYTLVDSSGAQQRVSPGVAVVLSLGEQYTLRMTYREDHRGCTVAPEDTMLLLEGARWRVERATQPLVLAAAPEWTTASRSHTGEVRFTANTAGTWVLEVLRECSREGYSARLEFTVR